MFSADLIKSGENVVMVHGQLVPATVFNLFKLSRKLFNGAAELEFDFSHVDKAQTAALSLMMEWLRCGRELKIPVKFSNLPDNLVKIAALSEVEGIILGSL